MQTMLLEISHIKFENDTELIIKQNKIKNIERERERDVVERGRKG